MGNIRIGTPVTSLQKTDDVLQLENNTEFHEFLEVHKSKSTKSAWVNDLVLPASEKHQHTKDKSGQMSRSSDAEEKTSVEKDAAMEIEPKKKLSDLEASSL